MSIDTDAAALRKIPLFRGIEDQKLRLLAFMSERVRFEAGENLVEEGDFGDVAYIILSGEADVLVASPSGEQLVATVKENDFVGEIALLIDVPRTATVRATSEIMALAVTKEHFFKLLGNFPDMALEVMRALAHRLERTTREFGRLRAAVANT
ncbi:cyclic nucleotide-binding domain-containing protein [Acuticoccus sp. I52.16.1]|uniref:cyclic nucleotide-binding domain-containing protein n=1 Tax=Acuticoccus sp. I52.16.1 TaxID=2928472 RepID=UPI001FD5C9B5|nr:Crp/Fnr family transcriptional regulator [Acuticoccus sp. I52.16.1]UOM33448.1 Crp/Fnr family transcriptional regulator [Acuticoccus sp. I52.16.1]